MDVRENRNVNFDGLSPSTISSSMDQSHYRQVPYRFFTNETNTDASSLEKLTNLFPDMKTTIELELFKVNNLSRVIDRLSHIYTVLTALDIRDDTLHLFLGPYHLSLGPALFAALHIKNASNALLGSSCATTTHSNENHRRKRRRDVAIRRFRRAVRKISLIKSIVNQLRPPSILTPYNQHELYSHGIYDLVLSGHEQYSESMFFNDDFLQQKNHINLLTNPFEKSPLFTSNFVKINNLLSFLSPNHQQSTESPLTTIGNQNLIRIKSNESLSSTKNNQNAIPTHTFNASSLGYTHYRQNAPYVTFPLRKTNSPQTSQFLSSGSRSRQSSHSNLLKTSSVLSRQSTNNSLSDSISGEGSGPELRPSTSPLPSPESNQIEIDLETPTNIEIQHSFFSSAILSSSPATNEEDALINRISSIIAHYFSSHQSTSIAITSNIAQENETNSNLNDSAISLSTSATAGPINTTVTSNLSSPSIIDNDFDKLLRRIKTAVHNRLSIETISNTRMRPLKTKYQDITCNLTRKPSINRRQQLLALHAVSCQEGHTYECDDEHPASVNNRHKLDLFNKSQSLDLTNLNNRDVSPSKTTTIDSSDNICEMSSFQSDEKGVQTDPRIRHARSKLLETLQAYVKSVTRYREHLNNQYTQSNINYEQHYGTLPELQKYEYKDLINVRKEILNRFEWVIHEIEQIIENLQTRRLSVADAEQRINRPLVKEVIESSLNADLPPVHEHQSNVNDRQKPKPTEDELRMYARDLQDTKEDLYIINSLVHRGISKIDRLVTFTNLYT